MNNSGTITGGTGGAGGGDGPHGGTAGADGVGVQGAGLAIVNTGTISGGGAYALSFNRRQQYLAA